jgi:thermitase
MSRRFTRSPQTHVLALCVLLALAAILPQVIVAQDGSPPYVPGEVLIGWSPDGGVAPTVQRPKGRLDEDRASPEWQRAAQTLAALTGLPLLDTQPEYGTARLAVPAGREQAEIARLRAMPWVEYAELNYIAWAAAAPQGGAFYPNDPYVGDQWNMRRIGAPEAWAVTFGSSSIVVAVLDSGVDLGHPEFADQFHDPLLPGYDFVNGDKYPNDDTANSHGTHVTGILAAAANNGIGVAGLAPKVKILPLKVLDSTGVGNYANIDTAIRRAADFGAQVINLSLGGSEPSTDLQNAVNYAMARNALVVAAAGNCAQGGSRCTAFNPDFYPAGYPGVLAVAASDHFDAWATYSGYKPYVGLAAPGGTGTSLDAVWSTARGGYAYLSGTSMAAPLVSGAAALVWTMAPAATYQQVTDILKSTADKVGTDPQTGQPISYVSGRNDYFGYGRLNVGKAVRQAYPRSLAPVTDVQQFLLGGLVTQQERPVALANPSGQELYWQATVIQGTGWLGVDPAIGTAKYDSPGTLTLRASRGALSPGVYLGTVRVQPLYVAGIPSFDIPVQLRVSDALSRTYVPSVVREWSPGQWFDPLAGGGSSAEPLNLLDNQAQPVGLPFTVPFYGGTFTRMSVSDNGLVVFGQDEVGATQLPAGCLATAAAPNNAIYVLALDWRPDLGGQVYVQQPDTSTVVVTWYQVRRAGNPLPQTFQLVLRRGGPITAHYQTVESPAPGIVGAENWDGTVAQQIRCNGAGSPISAGDTVVFNPALPW